MSHPNNYKFLLVIVDDYSRAALAYPIKSKTDVPACIESFVISLKNMLDKDNKLCYLHCDRGTEFVNAEVKELLEKYGAESQLACPDTPEHNGVAERFDRTIGNKIRVMMLDSGIPSSNWTLAAKAAVYLYNRTPHKSIQMKTPLSLISEKDNNIMSQIRRFGCLAFIKIYRSVKSKFAPQAMKGVLVGYLSTGYTVLVPRENTLYDRKYVRFIETLTYKNALRDDCPDEKLTFNELDNETGKGKVTDSEGVPGSALLLKKRGRPSKNKAAMFFIDQPYENLYIDEFDA